MNSVSFPSAPPALSRPPLISVPLPLPRRLLKASSLPSPRPRTKRPNRLRRETLIPKPRLPPPPAPLLPPPDEPRIVVYEEDVAVVERVVEELDVEEVVEGEAAVVVDPFAPAAAAAEFRFLPGELQRLALRFAVLLAVQTVVAVWFLGGERNGPSEQGMTEGKAGIEVREAMELDKKVLEIRAMAKKARETERRELAEDSGVKGEVGKKLGWLKKTAAKVILDENTFSLSLPASSKNMNEEMNGKKLNLKQKMGREKLNLKRKIGLEKSTNKAGNIPRGFNGSRSNDECRRGVSGGIEQIVEEAAHHPNPEDLRAHASELTQRSADIENYATSSSRGTVGRVSSGDHLHVSKFQKSKNYMEDTEDISFSGGTNSSSDIDEVFPKTQIWESSTEVTRRCSSETGKVNDDSRNNFPIENIESKSFVNKVKNSHLDAMNEPWWLKLPYVFAIFLRRGSDGNGLKGLYSLDMSSSSVKEKAPSYTIAFQDRGDATNFCYLVKTFFEDLGDVSADIVPLTVKELDQAVNGNHVKLLMFALHIKFFGLKEQIHQFLVSRKNSLGEI
ncbi:TspO/MBR family [Musa troglodytarum]|uniref:TspO/MBR family n=1 Tax=Musa troglodytarum TaxID=320322 RepID=A0A9E7HBU9_9LILI|nr:TspO/MBR family [Musa troglodytarum]URE28424.1 TspO/MBR family [Musa troglodytarum]